MIKQPVLVVNVCCPGRKNKTGISYVCSSEDSSFANTYHDTGPPFLRYPKDFTSNAKDFVKEQSLIPMIKVLSLMWHRV